jgi:cysteine desulfurase
MTDRILAEYCSGAKIGNISNDSFNAAKGKLVKTELDARLKFFHPGMQIIYTSGGSESNSTVINMFKSDHIVCSMSEHSSIIASLSGCNVTWVRPQPTGHVKIDDLLGATNSKTKLIILQSVNSETGALQDLMNLVAHNRDKIHIHCDNVQGYMKRLDMKNIVTYCNRVGQPLTLSFSFHKIGAPIGFGALLTNVSVVPLIGGKQNNSLRGGTYNVAAMKATIQAIKDYDYSKIIELRKYFDELISKRYIVMNYMDIKRMTEEGASLSSSGYIVLFSCDGCLPHTIFFAIGVNNMILCNRDIKNELAKKNIVIGYGSACNSESMDEKGSMRSADIPKKYFGGFLRVSLSCYNTKSEVKDLVNALGNLIKMI